VRHIVSTALGLAAVAAVVLPASASPAERAPASTMGPAANSTTYTDPQGDAQAGGMDITTVVVSNDDAGNLNFQIRIASHATFPPDQTIFVFLDIDRNNATGSSAGDEFVILALPPGNVTGLARWDTNQRTFVLVPGAAITGSFATNVQTLAFNRSVIAGNLATFEFDVGTGRDDRPDFDDFAPNDAQYTYEIRIGATPPPPGESRVRITSMKRVPRTPTAGESFTVTLTVARVGRAGRFNGTVYCSTLPGVQRRWFGSVGAGRASCRWDIPRNAVGKVVRGSISVSEDGPIVARRFSARVVSPELRLTRGALSYSPSQPRAGSVFYAAVDIRVRTGSASRGIRSGKVTCRATVGGRPQTVVQQKVRAGEDALCGWRISSGTTGRTLNGLITVQSEGATIRVPFTRTVR
jgi:hypothetical protein